MKKLYFLLSLLLTGITNAQNIAIPDANFKTAVLASGADSDLDGEISVTEAQNVIEISAPDSNIANVFGIENFTNLMHLDISGNPITEMYLGMNTQLEDIEISDTQLQQLDLTGLSLLQQIYGNNIPSLGTLTLTGCTSLYLIQVTGCSLGAIDLSTCPALSSITLWDDQLFSINFGPNTASSVILLLDNNHLLSLDLSPLTNLHQLLCSDNLLQSLDTSNNPSLTWLGCAFNSITTLDLSNNSNLSVLTADNNALQTIYMKNGALENATFANNPALYFICADEGQVTAVQTTAGASVVVNSYCTFTPGGDYNTITGAVRFDGNNNGCDINDVTAPFIKVNITEGVNTGATFTTANSLYSFYTGAGNFTVTPNLENPTFFTVSPASAAVNFPNVNNNVSTQNFCLSANGVHRDVEVAIAPITLARPGFDAQYEIVYKNKGNQTQNGSVTFNYNDNVLNFVSATPVPSSQATGLLTFNYTNLLPFENRIAKVTVHVNAPTDTPAVNAGYVLDFTTAITLNGTDETPADNTMNYHQTVVSSLDPNVKTCVEGNVVSPSEIGKYLHYVINFENTGTQAAQNIVVVDMIDISKFDINSLRVMNSSHPVDIRVTGNKAEFIFRDINLAIGGHGNILLKIKTLNSLTTGAVVSNKADIFFDYNFPVATNIANTTFQALGVNEHEFDNSITVYPNPAHDILNVKGQNNIKSIQLFDVQGRILQTNLVNENTATIDISGKQSGIYFLKITSDKGIKVEKIVKN